MLRQEIISVICMAMCAIAMGLTFDRSLKEHRPGFAIMSAIMTILDVSAIIFVLMGGMR